MTTTTKGKIKQIIPLGILIILMVFRFGDARLQVFLFGNEADQHWVYYINLSVPYLLICLVLWLERQDLSSLNVDLVFIIIFILIGAVLTFSYIPFPYGIFSGLGALSILFFYLKGGFTFGSRPQLSRILIFILIMLPPCLQFIYFKRSIPDSETLITALNTTNVFSVVFEEFLFRGLLWKYLRKIQLSEIATFLITSVLFWLAHYEVILGPRSSNFWIYIPLVSILLGYVVYRTKSIGLSSISHYLANVAVRF